MRFLSVLAVIGDIESRAFEDQACGRYQAAGQLTALGAFLFRGCGADGPIEFFEVMPAGAAKLVQRHSILREEKTDAREQSKLDSHRTGLKPQDGTTAKEAMGRVLRVLRATRGPWPHDLTARIATK